MDEEADGLDLDELNRRREAEEYCALGQERHAAGDIDDAAAYYQMAVELYPTAEAYTYLGITLAARGRWDEAIAQCEHAIVLAPDLGNPYNDIGVYLEKKNCRAEAIPYFEAAIKAPHYDCRNYPWYHLGRVYEQLCRFSEARDCYLKSLEIEPDWEPARVALRHCLGWLN